MKFSYSALTVIAAVVPATSALGINCQGSFNCNINGGGHGREAGNLVNYINDIDENRWYNNGEQIACTMNYICAFLQNTGGAPGRNIKGLASKITDHGCKVCGSVPYFYPAINDVSQGMLTFNYAQNKCHGGSHHGLC